MADVARKIGQIEMAMGSEEGLCQLASDETVHYNPADLSSWLGSMLSGLDPMPRFPSPDNCSVTASVDLDFGSDLGSVPGKAVYPPLKKVKTSPSQKGCFQEKRSVVLGSQENGIRLVHSLMACAEAVQEENFTAAEAFLKKVVFFAVSQAGAMRKVATYFVEALAQRIYCWNPMMSQGSAAFSDANLLQRHFYETCPYLKFAHFTANQAILEAFSGKKRVHVIDFSINHGVQWPPLLYALATQDGGAPTFRLTGIAPPSHDDLNTVGLTLAEFAGAMNIEFRFRSFVTNSLADLNPSMLEIQEGEALAVNSILDLHQLLANPGAIDKVLQLVHQLNPLIFTIAEQEANHNSSIFLDRFTEALHHYSTLFDSLESGGRGGDEDKLMSEVYLGQQIHNVVAGEGLERVERHETLSQWRTRFGSHGFLPVHHGSNVYKLATELVAVDGGDGYTVAEDGGCLMLGWHMRPLIAASAWTGRESREF